MKLHTIVADNPHIRLNESNEDYHADTEHVSHSMLREFSVSRPRYKQRFVTHEMSPPPTTDSMILGTALHHSVLEPDKWPGLYTSIIGDRRTKAVKAAIADAEASGKVVLKQDDMRMIQDMTSAVYGNEMALCLLQQGGIAECSIRWEDSETGIKCKCRPDWLFMDGHGQLHCVDIKTTKSLEGHFDGFDKTAFSYGYDTQAAWYSRGIHAATGKLPGFGFIVVSKDSPPLCEVWQVDDEMMGIAESLLVGTTRELQQATKTNDWRNPREKSVNILTVPKWRKANQ